MRAQKMLQLKYPFKVLGKKVKVSGHKSPENKGGGSCECQLCHCMRSSPASPYLRLNNIPAPNSGICLDQPFLKITLWNIKPIRYFIKKGS